jgi:hypothetical protein
VHDDGAVPGGDDSAAAPAREGPVDGFPAGADPGGEEASSAIQECQCPVPESGTGYMG